MQDFDGKVAVVAGAASGIGRALAERFAREGMRVVLADVEQPALDAAVQELRQAAFDVVGVKTDVSSAQSVEELARQTIDTFGSVHILCSNAGVGGGRGLIWQCSEKDWQWVFGVNFWGVVNCARAFTPLMIEHGQPAHIVNTASVAGITPSGGPYGVSKHAVVAFTEGLYTQLKLVGTKVGVSVLCPGFVRTNINNAARNRPPELQNEDEPPVEGIEAMIMKQMEESVAGGMPPEDVAQIVLDGIRNDQFWITTTRELDDAIAAAAQSIIDRTNPAAQSLV